MGGTKPSKNVRSKKSYFFNHIFGNDSSDVINAFERESADGKTYGKGNEYRPRVSTRKQLDFKDASCGVISSFDSKDVEIYNGTEQRLRQILPEASGFLNHHQKLKLVPVGRQGLPTFVPEDWEEPVFVPEAAYAWDATKYEQFVPATKRQSREQSYNEPQPDILASCDVPAPARRLAGCQPSRGFDVFMMLVVSIGFMVARRF